ncbi:MAG: hypothetical protein KKE44_22660 [Proteobacteria bacterium]|nr:hypothetical protein [Pseudomonadota bacterium]MBU1585535.1 hypothetical protein [Pseudomonadota bacterium]MBU2452703.1 hypothetical protein [Pseudomonadota bacterium]MBU2630041.1 hypothetical protein [Pseudomonadota bacterium]
MKKRWPFLIGLILIVAAVMAWVLILKEKKDPDTLMVSGNIEATELIR